MIDNLLSIAAGGDCGKSKYSDAGEYYLPDPRIVGGVNARPYEFPWQVGSITKIIIFKHSTTNACVLGYVAPTVNRFRICQCQEAIISLT